MNEYYLLDAIQRGNKIGFFFDGGGERGAIIAATLVRLEEITGKRIQELVHFVSGTSTGAILAFAIGLGMSAGEIQDKIYRKGLPAGFAGQGISSWLNFLKSGFNHFYPLEPFLASLKPYAKGRRVQDIEHPIVMVVTKDARSGNNYFVVSKGPGSETFGHWPIPLAIAASGSAPIYFPPVLGYLLDGGVGVYGNPCHAGLIQMFEYLGEEYGFTDGNVIGISFGTGYTPHEYRKGASKFNIIDWVKYIILEGLEDAATNEAISAKGAYGKRADFRRYNPLLTTENIRTTLGIMTSPKVKVETLGLDSVKWDEILLMESIGARYAELIDWSKPSVMPWQTIGGRPKPGILPVDYVGSMYDI